MALIFVLLFGIIIGLVGFINQASIKEAIYWATKVRPYQLSASAESGLKLGDKPFKECEDCPEMVVLPPGRFVMGDEDNGPRHEVTISYRVAVGRYEVTFDQWDACVAAGGCKNPAPDAGWGRGTRPVINITWLDGKEYVAWLSKLTGKPYRLLSEAEWEYGTRAGSQGKWTFGDDAGEIVDYAWFDANSELKTHPVGQKKPNAFGLYDVHGNVSEWTEDQVSDSYEGAPTDGSARTGPYENGVDRGGSWRSDGAEQLASAARLSRDMTIDRDSNTGLRVGRTLSP